MSDRGLAVVTGASSGLGVEFARIFASRGNDVVLVARRENRLRRLAADLEKRYRIDAAALPFDLATPDAAATLHARVVECGGDPDFLVSNAGFGLLGAVHELPAGRQAEMIRLNVAAVAEGARVFLPAMVSRGSGRILNVASTASFQPGPRMAAYFATKAFVLSYTEALAEELRGTGVTATALCPGPVPTEFGRVAGFPESKVVDCLGMSARSVARAGYLGMMRGRPVVIPGAVNYLGTVMAQVAPRAVVRRVVGGFLRAIR